MDGPLYLAGRQYSMARELVLRGELELADLASRLGARQEDLMRDLAELERLGLVTTAREERAEEVLTEEGRRYAEVGLPEERLAERARECLGRPVQDFLKCVEAAGMTAEEARIAVQHMFASGCLRSDGGLVVAGRPSACQEAVERASRYRQALQMIGRGERVDDEILRQLRRRRLVEERKRTIVRVRATQRLVDAWSRGLVLEREVVTVVTPAIYRGREKYVIKEFDLEVEIPSARASMKHPFMDVIRQLRELLISMGFEEVRGPPVELEFWNFDALFQAQDHPAREIHDTFFVKGEARGKVPEELLARARLVHESKWGPGWSPERALRLVLRTQCTAVSARTIYERGPGEYRAFTIDRVFRPENLDAKHSMEFYQLDGIIVGRDVNFKHLLYFFKEFAAALGIREVWFKPAYFPFTEPSVEGFVRHEKLGWMEVFPGGVFRPEVMEILGANGVRAIAWGIGVDRLAMHMLGIDDIRLLFAKELEVLRSMKRGMLPFMLRRTDGRDVRVVEVPSNSA
ncbi:MAG: phenylalanine--tRNA ligase subunit alpha [Desulfurococcaceae archaeon]